MILKKLTGMFLILCLGLWLNLQPVSFGAAQVNQMENLSPVSLTQAQESLARQRGFFTENKGQWGEDILFMGDTDFGRIIFTKKAVYYQKIHEKEQDVFSSNIIELSFVGAEIPNVEGLEVLPHYHNYMIGNDSSRWATYCRNFAQVTYENLWEGIDLAYFFSPEGLKYEYYVHPHAKVEDLQVQVNGAMLGYNSDTLLMNTPLGTLKDDQLLVFGQDSGNLLDVSFTISEDTFSFAGLPNERTETIVIDPLVYSTYLGGSGGDIGGFVAIDSAGNAYITGSSGSADFPMDETVGGSPAPGYDQNFNGSVVAFVSKLNAEGTELIYSTFLGSTSNNRGLGIAVDEAGNAYLTGRTFGADFPMDSTVGGPLAPGYDQTWNGNQCAFAVKLDATGTELLYSTYLGGSGADYGYAIAIDPWGNAYIGGSTASLDFPMDVTVGGPPAPGYDQSSSPGSDAFLVKLNSAGTELLYATYLKGSGYSDIMGIAVDDQGHAYVTGEATSADFPMDTTVGGPPAPGYDQVHNGMADVFVIKFNPSGTELLYATFLGGSERDYAYSIAIDSEGNAYITGETYGADFPMDATVGGPPAPGYDQSFNGTRDAFVVKLDATGTELLYSTFLGGSGIDFAYDIAVDTAGYAYITGETLSADFPMDATVGGSPAPGYDQSYNGMEDAFVVKLNRTGTELMYTTFLGDIAPDYGRSIAVDSDGYVYVAGFTWSNNFPTDRTVGGNPAPGYSHVNNGNRDIFLVKLELPRPILEITASLDEVVYEQGDNPLLEIVLSNTGNSIATANEVEVILPPALGFMQDQDYPVTIGSGNSLIFYVGDLPYGESLGFTVYMEVLLNVSADEAVNLEIEVNCLEGASATTTSAMLLRHILDTSPPHLRIWAEVNKPAFFKGEEAMLFVTVANQGEEPATYTRVTVTIPRETRFLRATRYRSQVLTPEMIEIEMGTIAPLSVQSFQVDLSVEVAVAQPRTLPVFFDVTCAEESSDFTHVMLQLVPQRSGQPDLYLGLYYRNAQWDPQTGSLFIVQDATLEIDFVLTGARLPYDLTIDWGDGERTHLDDQRNVRQTLQHTFRSQGLMKIEVEVTDQLSRTRTANLQMEVR